MSKSEETWIASQRKIVQQYLERERVDHLGVGEYPAFHVYPYLALWAVESKRSPGWIGWWAISGDLPTDYVTRGKIAHPREALQAFARHWRELSVHMLRGEEHPDVKIGTRDQWPELGDLLQRRAQILQTYADDDEIWEEKPAECAKRRSARRRTTRAHRRDRRSVSLTDKKQFHARNPRNPRNPWFKDQPT